MRLTYTLPDVPAVQTSHPFERVTAPDTAACCGRWILVGLFPGACAGDATDIDYVHYWGRRLKAVLVACNRFGSSLPIDAGRGIGIHGRVRVDRHGEFCLANCVAKVFVVVRRCGTAGQHG